MKFAKFAKFSHQFRDHPKIDSLTDGAVRLHVNAILYASEHLTNGFIEATRAPRLTPTFKQRLPQELVAAGLWHPVDGGWEIHDYLDHQLSADEAKAKSEARANAGRAGGIKSGATRRSKRFTHSEANASPVSEANGSAFAEADVDRDRDTPPPTSSRPADQSHDEVNGGGGILTGPIHSGWPRPVLDAATLHAALELAGRPESYGPIETKTRWLRSVKVNWLAENGGLAARLLAQKPDRQPDELVRLCNAVEQPAARRPQREPHDECSDSGWLETDNGDVVRCSCVQPHNPDLRLVNGGTQ